MKNRDPLAFIFYIQKTYQHHLTFVIMMGSLGLEYQRKPGEKDDFVRSKQYAISVMFACNLTSTILQIINQLRFN